MFKANNGDPTKQIGAIYSSKNDSALAAGQQQNEKGRSMEPRMN